jgi:hypothetical protein
VTTNGARTQLGKATDESASSEEGGDGDGRCAHISTEGSELSVDELTFEQIIDNEIGLVQKLHHPNIIKIKEVGAWVCVRGCLDGWLCLGSLSGASGPTAVRGVAWLVVRVS